MVLLLQLMFTATKATTSGCDILTSAHVCVCVWPHMCMCVCLCVQISHIHMCMFGLYMRACICVCIHNDMFVHFKGFQPEWCISSVHHA